MKLALIPPISLLEYTAETYCQLMLPHLIKDDQYRHTYKLHCEDDSQFVILDNGEAEGVSTDWVDLMDIAYGFGVDEVVLPDVIGNATATRLKATAALGWAQRHFSTKPFQFMYVVQGSSYEEFEESAFWAIEQDAVDTLGLPRHMIKTCQDLEARIKLADAIDGQTPDGDKEIHLLGGSPFYPHEIANYEWPPIVRSTDTSSPFNYAYSKNQYEGQFLNAGDEVHRPEGYFELMPEEFDTTCIDVNVEDLMLWTGNDA